MIINVAIIQMEIRDGEKPINLSKALEYLKYLRDEKIKPDIICFPELFTTGYDLRNVKMLAEMIPGPTIEKMSQISKDNFIVIGTILETREQKYYNTAFILGKNGNVIGTYSKIHLFSPMLEKEFLMPGNRIPTFTIPELDNLTIGIAICYDLRFPEIFRKMALDGAQAIIVPSEFPSPKRDTWIILSKARAIENQLFIIGTNRVGEGRTERFFGSSIITNGDHSEIMGENEEIKVLKIDFNSLIKIRQKLPLLNDRRSDLY